MAEYDGPGAYEKAFSEEAAPPAAPVPDSQGTYAVYRTPKGAIHLVYRPEGAEEDQHLEIPAMIVNMAEKAASGENVGGPFGKMLQKRVRGGS